MQDNQLLRQAQKLYNQLEKDGAFLTCYAISDNENGFIDNLNKAIKWQVVYTIHDIPTNKIKPFKTNLIDNAKSYYQSIKRMDKIELDNYIDSISNGLNS